MNLPEDVHVRIDALVGAFKGVGASTRRATVAADALAEGLSVLEEKFRKERGKKGAGR